MKARMCLPIDAIRSKALVLATCLIFYSTVWAQQLVLRGDHPDPSVVKIGDRYWATATTSNWMPAYPILESKDLVNWKLVSHVFPTLPQWADYYFWAPEISYEKGKVYVYYAAHKKGGNLCVGVASANKPEGPYVDHGPLMCQDDGSIDAFAMRDENGKLYLIWKEDANSVGRSTPIWAMQMNEERTALVGEKKELFRNVLPWEGNLVEGVSMVRHGDYFYAFYAGAGCCGAACTYGVGIARSKTLLGPWEKYDKNPLLTSGPGWTCPGHGTPVEKDGHYYFLYHAYDRNGNVYTGRQGLLIEYRLTPDGWIEFIKEKHAATAIENVNDDFTGSSLSKQWQWSVFEKPLVRLKDGVLYLGALPSSPGIFLGRSIAAGDYVATVKVNAQKCTAAAGLAAIGDEKNNISLMYQNNRLRILQVKDGKETVLTTQKLPKKASLSLQMQVKNGKEISFLYSTGQKDYKALPAKQIDGSFLPPWDRAVRVGIVSRGAKGSFAVFDRFQIHYK